MTRDFGYQWIGFGLSSFLAYVVSSLRPESEIARVAFSLLCLTTFVLGWFWLLESAVIVGRRFSDWRTDVLRERAVLADPDAALADIIRRMSDDARRVFAMLVEINFDQDNNKPLPGCTYLTRSYALRFFALALDSYPDLPSIRRARGEYMPREQAAELTAWLVREGCAKPGRGSSPARWVSVDAKLQAARKFEEM